MRVMMSIHPKWVEKIASGRKRWEIRKTAPKEVPCNAPFKVYIYCTKSGRLALYKNPNNGEFFLDKHGWRGGDYEDRYFSGKVIGEFVCDRIEEIRNCGGAFWVMTDGEGDIAKTNLIARESCLDYDDMRAYLGDKNGYAWHISDLRVYDKPKDLSEFAMRRPFQSWGYIKCQYHTMGEEDEDRNEV